MISNTVSDMPIELPPPNIEMDPMLPPEQQNAPVIEGGQNVIPSPAKKRQTRSMVEILNENPELEAEYRNPTVQLPGPSQNRIQPMYNDCPDAEIFYAIRQFGRLCRQTLDAGGPGNEIQWKDLFEGSTSREVRSNEAFALLSNLLD